MTRPAELHLLGVSFRTAPVAVREALHFDREQALEFVRELASDHPDLEVLVVSTCNRSEFYLVSGDGAGAVEALLATLRRVRPDAPVLRADCPRYHLEGQEAARHLLRVASGTDSQILGDVQVLGQIREAGLVADEGGTLGPQLRRLLGHAVRAGKRAREETAIGRGAASLGSALASLLAGRGRERILILGAGEVARDIGRHLAKRGLGPLWFVNRTAARAAELAAECRGAAHEWSALDALLREADVVIAATSALVLRRDALAAAAAARPERPLLVVDAGVPRNVEPGSPVPVLDLDTIRERQAEVLAARQAAVPAVEAIVAEETDRFTRWVGGGATEDLIRSLFGEAADASREAAGLLSSAAHVGPDDVERVFLRSFKRLLHGHVRRLRAAAPFEAAASVAAVPGFCEVSVRALVVDDSTAMRTILTRMLRELGMEVEQAKDGREALAHIAVAGLPDVMLVDWNMPEMNGLELVRAVRQDLGQRSSLMMMVTTETETAQMVKAFAAGANEYLMKPFTKEALIEKLDLLGVDTSCGKSAS